MNLANLGLDVPIILLPKASTDLTRWAVIACDQYTSEPEYWQAIDHLVANQPSTLRLIFPEVYLEEDGSDARIADINSAMSQYLAERERETYFRLKRFKSYAGRHAGMR